MSTSSLYQIIPILIILIGSVIGWAATISWIKTQVKTNEKNITALWEKKSDMSMYRLLEKRVKERDKIFHVNERDNQVFKIYVNERFAKLEKMIEIQINNHSLLMDIVNELKKYHVGKI